MESGDQIVFGRHPVMEALKAGAAVQRISVSRNSSGIPRELFTTAEALDIPVVRTGNDRLDFLSRGGNHQGVVAQVSARHLLAFEDWLNSVQATNTDIILALDQVQDPQNLGALLRTCDGAGCSHILLSAARSCGLTSTVSKVSTGADQYLSIGRTQKMGVALEKLVQLGYQVVATTPASDKPYFEVDFTEPTVILLGGEERGLPPHLRRASTEVVNIPMLGKIESLNVASSGAILLYEMVRQRKV